MTTPTPVETPYGTLYVDPEELVIGRLLQENGQLPDISQEVAFFRKYLNPGDTAIDVGANYGLFTLALAQIVGEDGYVVSYEPNRDLHQYLRKTAKGSASHFGVSSSALGASIGFGEIRLDPRGSGGTQVIPRTVYERLVNGVDIDTLDKGFPLHHRPIKAIKIDAEGMDVDVLLGAEKILREDRPVVIFEWNPEAMRSLGKDPEIELGQLVGLNERVDYDVYDLEGNIWPDRLLGNMALLPDELMLES